MRRASQGRRRPRGKARGLGWLRGSWIPGAAGPINPPGYQWRPFIANAVLTSAARGMSPYRASHRRPCFAATISGRTEAAWRRGMSSNTPTGVRRSATGLGRARTHGGRTRQAFDLERFRREMVGVTNRSPQVGNACTRVNLFLLGGVTRLSSTRRSIRRIPPSHAVRGRARRCTGPRARWTAGHATTHRARATG